MSGLSNIIYSTCERLIDIIIPGTTNNISPTATNNPVSNVTINVFLKSLVWLNNVSISGSSPLDIFRKYSLYPSATSVKSIKSIILPNDDNKLLLSVTYFGRNFIIIVPILVMMP